jgi:predicted Zn finger-like uncharacterized protein
VFTHCPSCSTVYEVHARDLTVAQGRVRCGFCTTTFNALEFLTEDAPAHGFTTTGLSPPDPLDEAAAPHPAAAAAVEQTPPPSLEEPVLTTDTPSADAEAEAGSEAVTETADAIDDAVAHDAAAGEPAAAAAPPAAIGDDAIDLPVLFPARRGPRRAAWAIAAAVLLVALAAQVVHRQRGELVQDPRFSMPMQRVYGALGLELDPHWNVSGYAVTRPAELTALPAQGGAPGALQLVAVFTNRAERPQPLPLLRVRLEDRWGSAIAARDFDASEYLRHPVARDALLAPGAEAQAELRIVDPGVETVGFSLDLCLADARGVVHCAYDAS